MNRELLVGSYVRRDGRKCRVVRIEGTWTYRAYVDGDLAVEGPRAACMKVAR